MWPNWPNFSQVSPFRWPSRCRGGHRWRSAVVAGLRWGLATADRHSHTHDRRPQGARPPKSGTPKGGLGVLMEGSQGSPGKGRPLARPAVESIAQLRRAPPPLDLFYLRRVAADVLLSEPAPQHEGNKAVEDGDKNITRGRAANEQVHGHQHRGPGCGQHEHNNQGPQDTVRAAGTCGRISHFGKNLPLHVSKQVLIAERARRPTCA
jgi:hypothetical protein